MKIATKRNVPGIMAAGDGCLLSCAWEEREGVLGPANTYSFSSVRGSWDKLREPGTGFSRSFPFSTGMASICRAVWGPMPYKPFRAFSGKIEFISDMDRRHAVLLEPSVSQTHATSS